MEPSDDMTKTPGSPFRLIGLIGFVGGTVASAQLFAHGAGWIWVTLAALIAAISMVAMAVGLRQEALAGRSRLTTPEKAQLCYDQLQGLWVVGFVLSFIFASLYLPGVERVWLRAGLIAVPLGFLAVLVTEFIRMVVRSDELQRGQQLIACSIAGGAVVVVATVWSMLSSLVGGWSDAPGIWLLPAFAVVYGIALSLIRRREA